MISDRNWRPFHWSGLRRRGFLARREVSSWRNASTNAAAFHANLHPWNDNTTSFGATLILRILIECFLVE